MVVSVVLKKPYFIFITNISHKYIFVNTNLTEVKGIR